MENEKEKSALKSALESKKPEPKGEKAEPKAKEAAPKKEGKGSGKKVSEMHIKKVNGGHLVKHIGEPEGSNEHVVPDGPGGADDHAPLEQHMQENYGAAPEGATPSPAVGNGAQGAMPGGSY